MWEKNTSHSIPLINITETKCNLIVVFCVGPIPNNNSSKFIFIHSKRKHLKLFIQRNNFIYYSDYFSMFLRTGQGYVEENNYEYWPLKITSRHRDAWAKKWEICQVSSKDLTIWREILHFQIKK